MIVEKIIIIIIITKIIIINIEIIKMVYIMKIKIGK
jgi:hypothetical protein